LDQLNFIERILVVGWSFRDEYWSSRCLPGTTTTSFASDELSCYTRNTKWVKRRMAKESQEEDESKDSKQESNKIMFTCDQGSVIGSGIFSLSDTHHVIFFTHNGCFCPFHFETKQSPELASNQQDNKQDSDHVQSESGRQLEEKDRKTEVDILSLYPSLVLCVNRVRTKINFGLTSFKLSASTLCHFCKHLK